MCGYYSHKRRESDDKNAVAIVKFVPQLGCVSEALVSKKQPWRNPMQKVLGLIRKGTIHSVYATSSKYPGKERTIAWKNTSQKSSPAKSLERQQRCARSKAWNLAENKNKLKENDKAAFYSPAEEWVHPAASTKEPEERELKVDSGASMHMVNKRDINSAELETMRTSSSPTTVI